VNTDVQRVVRLPVLGDGVMVPKLTVRDVSGNAGECPITISSLDSATLEGETNRAVVMHTPRGSIDLAYGLGNWVVVNQRSHSDFYSPSGDFINVGSVALFGGFLTQNRIVRGWESGLAVDAQVQSGSEVSVLSGGRFVNFNAE
jgi:hypothetical protein